MSTPFGPTPSVGNEVGFGADGEDPRSAEYLKTQGGGTEPDRVENAI